MRLTRYAAAAAVAAAFSLNASAQEKIEVKVAEFVGAQHFMSKWLVGWGERIEKASGGKLAVKHFFGASMAPVPGHYDLAASGRAEVSWLLHGATPGRFPLTELTHLPYVVGSSEIGTKVINDAGLRAKYLDPEHKGVKVLLLLTHQPGNINTTKKPVRATDDLRGLRVRPSSPTIGAFLTALGGTVVAVSPADQLDSLQKGTIDGTFIDYGGAGIAFKMGGTIKYVTEMYSYVSSFGVAANQDWYNKLAPELKKAIDDSVKGVEKEVGMGWDALDDVGKKLLVDGGAQPIKLSGAEDGKFRKVGAQVTEAKLKELEGKGLPARQAFAQIKSLSEKHAKTSRNFWN